MSLRRNEEEVKDHQGEILTLSTSKFRVFPSGVITPDQS